MKTLRIILALSLCGAVSTSHALISRLSKPLLAGLARAKALQPKFIIGSGLFGTTSLLSSYAYQQKFIHENAFERSGTVTIKNLAGNVDVEGWDQDRLHVEISKGAQNQATLNDMNVETKITADTADINAVYKGKYTFDDAPTIIEQGSKTYFNGQQAPSIHYSVKVPRLAHVIVRNRVGKIQFKDVDGSVIAETISGDIDTEKCNNITANSTSGSIHLKNARGSYSNAKTVSGNISITGDSRIFFSSTASSVTGNVSINGAREAHGTSVTGNVEIRGATKGSAKSTTGNAIFFGE